MKQIISNKMGIPQELFWGYIGLIFFMLGATIETSWFSSFLNSIGFEMKIVSLIFSLYGVSVALFSWISSFLVERYGVKKIMAVSIVVFLISLILLLISIFLKQPLLTGLVYMTRGVAYPLFAYSFLVAVTVKSDVKQLGRATSWFWLSFNLGMTIIGPILSTQLVGMFDGYTTFIIGGLFVILGGIITLILISEPIDFQESQSVFENAKAGVTILFHHPRLFVGMVVKAINNIGQFGFVIMMPVFLLQHGFTLLEWSSSWSLCYIVNALAGVFFGNLGDHLGWRKVVMLFSGTIAGLACLLLVFVIKYLPGNFIALLLSFSLFSVGIAAFGPLSALIPSMIPEEKVLAVSVLNLGSGLSNFIGPVLVTLLFQQYGGNIVLIVFAILYLSASTLSCCLKTTEEIRKRQQAKIEINQNF